MNDLMSIADARARLGEIRDGGDDADFINSGAEVQLRGTYNVEDLEALYVLMIYGATV